MIIASSCKFKLCTMTLVRGMSGEFLTKFDITRFEALVAVCWCIKVLSIHNKVESGHWRRTLNKVWQWELPACNIIRLWIIMTGCLKQKDTLNTRTGYLSISNQLEMFCYPSILSTDFFDFNTVSFEFQWNSEDLGTLLLILTWTLELQRLLAFECCSVGEFWIV